ncbi:hypothetical protein [Leptotrichia wadei]|uniref:hypothetical protein n=1 Tax=Leptotrichia wadei TaxID=157687 RepID=UPI0011BF9E70|nr:hypothetical protein [Leptotrichia wadei]
MLRNGRTIFLKLFISNFTLLLVTGYEYAVLVAEIKFECFKNEDTTPFDLDKRLQTIVINRSDWEDEIQELLNKEIEFWECVKTIQNQE